MTQQQTQSTNKGTSTKTAKNKLPLILTTPIPRNVENIRVNCEPADAESFQQYIQFSYECQEFKGQYSHQELEVRFNAMAWNALWRRDAAFKEWMRQKRNGDGEE